MVRRQRRARLYRAGLEANRPQVNGQTLARLPREIPEGDRVRQGDGKARGRARVPDDGCRVDRGLCACDRGGQEIRSPPATPWLEIAIKKLGLAEIPGKKNNNAEIVRMFALCGHPEITDDETAWCAVFVGSCLIEAKYPAPERKGATMARSFLRYGVPVKPKDVRPGDLRIEKRPEGGPDAGHVEIVIEVNGDRVKTVAGNVSNRVKYDDKPLQGGTSSAIAARSSETSR